MLSIGMEKVSRYSAVGIATSYWLDDRGVGVLVPVGVKNFYLSTSSRPALGSTQPPIQLVPGAFSPGIKRPGREADHSPPTNAEVKKTSERRSIHPLPHTPSWGSAYLVKYSYNFTFLPYRYGKVLENGSTVHCAKNWEAFSWLLERNIWVKTTAM
jgi:hypothetical protein